MASATDPDGANHGLDYSHGALAAPQPYMRDGSHEALLSEYAEAKEVVTSSMARQHDKLEFGTVPRRNRRWFDWLGVAIGSVCLILVLILCSQYHSTLEALRKLQDGSHSPLGNVLGGAKPDAAANTNSSAAASSQYLLGVGKADITGPIVELNFMGYANGSQTGSGLRQRLYSRAFIVADAESQADRFIYMVLDTQSGDTAIRNGILDGLKAMGPEYAVYTQQNVAVTGTHSHSGPGAWLNYLLPQVTSLGFDKQSYQAIVDGCLLSIRRAHDTLLPGTLSFGSTRIDGANINRSLFAYLNNPSAERARYGDDTVDKTLTMLRFHRASDSRELGVLTWFPVHGTSMLGNNTLVTGDNKGVAANLFEKSIPYPYFVAGFSQSNVGDTSPNVNGAYCEEGPSAGQECSLDRSTCDGKNEPCHGRGPFYGLDDAGTRSCLEIGLRQFVGASELFTDAAAFTQIGGPVRSLHTFQDLSNYTFTLPNGTRASTCSAALGYSFAAGTSDGPGAFDFKQGDSGKPDANPFWGVVSKLLHKPSEEQVACQAPKPILLDAGATRHPYDWAPNVVDVQLLRVGQLFIIVSPGEATTMSGRRWKAAVADEAKSLGLVPDEALVVLGGPANSYTHYIATEEEYAVQRYEGASTLYGPHTLAAYMDLTRSLMPYLAASPPAAPLQPGPRPQDNRNRSLSFISPVVFDRPPLFKSFGQVLVDAPATVRSGGSVVATFVAANPRNNLRLEGTYAAVELLFGSDSWMRVVDDADWELALRWRRTSTLVGTSEADVVWDVPLETPPGVYRLRYYGDSRALVGGDLTPFEGASQAFSVV